MTDVHGAYVLGCTALLALAPVATILLSRFRARLAVTDATASPAVSAGLGQALAQAPALVVFPLLVSRSPNHDAVVVLSLSVLWTTFFAYQVFVRSTGLHQRGQTIARHQVLAGAGFHALSGALNAWWVGWLGPYGDDAWFQLPTAWIGSVVFFAGLMLTVWACQRRDAAHSPMGDPRRPTGGLFDVIAYPERLGVAIVVTGWAIATWSLAGLTLLVCTLATQVPRSVADHQKGRSGTPSALVPYVV